MVSMRTGMGDFSLCTDRFHSDSNRALCLSRGEIYLICSALQLAGRYGDKAGDVPTVLLADHRADSAGPVQSLGRPRVASAGAAPRRDPLRILRAARGFILSGKRRRTGAGTKYFLAH